VLLFGVALGAVMGAIIHFFKVQPFIVTLAGMFFARGMCFVISTDAITISDPFYRAVALYRIPIFGKSFISINVVIVLVVLVAAIYLAHLTRFGRTVYAIGGNEQSALLMGLPVARTKILVYTLNGFCSALAGVVFSIYMLSGYGLYTYGLELEAIASVVIGGTMLTGGVGYVIGTVFGVLIQGLIQTIIMFQGTLNSWWTKIVIGLLTLLFIGMQSLFALPEPTGRGARPDCAWRQSQRRSRAGGRVCGGTGHRLPHPAGAGRDHPAFLWRARAAAHLRHRPRRHVGPYGHRRAAAGGVQRVVGRAGAVTQTRNTALPQPR
jgi:ribose/xylose/arabinose/galactoside ABC-type transport system permease subunit